MQEEVTTAQKRLTAECKVSKSMNNSIKQELIENGLESQHMETQEAKIDDNEISNYEDFDQVFGEINDIKSLFEKQGEALQNFRKTLKKSKGENGKLLMALNSLENDKKELSEVLDSTDAKELDIDHSALSPIPINNDGSLFFSEIDNKKFTMKARSANRSEKKTPGFIKKIFVESHISALAL